MYVKISVVFILNFIYLYFWKNESNFILHYFQICAPHPFVSSCLTTKVSDSSDLQDLLANFRACGGRYKHKEMDYNDNQQSKITNLLSKNLTSVDILDLNNHQRIAVLFCSFSHCSNNAPAFCVNPWLVFLFL